MPKYHLLDKDGNLIRIYIDVEIDVRDRVIRLYNTMPGFETEAIISLAPGDRLERIHHENRGLVFTNNHFPGSSHGHLLPFHSHLCIRIQPRSRLVSRWNHIQDRRASCVIARLNR